MYKGLQEKRDNEKVETLELNLKKKDVEKMYVKESQTFQKLANRELVLWIKDSQVCFNLFLPSRHNPGTGEEKINRITNFIPALLIQGTSTF